MKLIFIYGAPAVGKLTVANEIAALMGYKVFHNHLSIDCVQPIFEFGTPSFWKMVERIRLDVVAEAARVGLNGLIYTFCYAKGSDDVHIDRVIEAVESNGGEVCFVLLKCEQAELERRVVAESRKQFGKMKTVDTLHNVLEKYDLSSPVPQRESLIIDTTNISSEKTAKQIVKHYNLL